MATWNFIIYAKTDFSVVDFNGNIVTNSTINPISITVEDNDDWLGSATAFNDTNGQQTIMASSDPSLVGQYIELNQPVSPQDSNLVDSSGPAIISILDIAIGGSNGFVMALDGNTNSELQPSTTYSDTDPGTGRSGIRYEWNSIPCYAPGTVIDTPDGPRLVETLMAGDMVNTLDHGPQLIRWVRCSEHPLEDVNVQGKPVLIAAGALGKGLPEYDLIVSPQHRILVGGGGQLTQLFSTKAFAPAKALTILPGIRHMKGKDRIAWVHFACDRHEVIKANGCLSESLLLGPMVVNGLTLTERRALARIFGSCSKSGAAINGPSVLPCLEVGEIRRQIANRKGGKRIAAAKGVYKWDRDAAMERHEVERLHEEIRANHTRKVIAALSP